MKTIHIVTNKETKSECDKLVADISKKKELRVFIEILNANSTNFLTKREAGSVINKYAVTKLPFVLLTDNDLPEDKQEYAAVYSEEGPITIDRINAKL